MAGDTVQLRDGARVAIRPIEPGDREALRDGFAKLSPQSRYRRFFSSMSHLRERDLDYLTQVDHHRHEALVAVDPETGEGVGVARYVLTGPDVAEPAVAVVDDWQGRGVGGQLLDALVERAVEEGVRWFEAQVLAENEAALRALERLGETTEERDGRELHVRVELSPHAEPPSELYALLRQIAAGAMAPARTLGSLLWWHRRDR